MKPVKQRRASTDWLIAPPLVKILNSLSSSLHSPAETCRTPVGQSSSQILCQSSSSALELSSARNSGFGNAALDLCDFVELAPLGSSLTETSVELSYEAYVLLPGQVSSIQARFSFFDASVGYTAEILQEFLERVGSYLGPSWLPRVLASSRSSSTCLPWSRSTSASTSMGVLWAPRLRDPPDWYHRLQLSRP